MARHHRRRGGLPVTARPAARVLVVGAGGIGGIVAGELTALPAEMADVTALTTNPVIAEAVTTQGYRLLGADGSRTVPGRCVTALPDDTPGFDWVLLATQPPEVEAAARATARWLAPGGAMVCFQNGLCEARVAAIVGDDRVIGAVVAWGAAMPQAGLYERTASGGFTLGRMDGTDDPRIPGLAMLLEAIGPVTTTCNLSGARWSKLAINCAISTLGTLGGDRLGAIMLHITVRRLALQIMTEAVRVAHAEGVRLEKVAGTIDLDWLALTPEDEADVASPGLAARHALLLAVGARYRRMRSSMLAAIERGRTPAVDFLNGEVVERGVAHGVDTPVNRAAQRWVHTVAKGEAHPGMETVYALAREVGLR